MDQRFVLRTRNEEGRWVAAAAFFSAVACSRNAAIDFSRASSFVMPQTRQGPRMRLVQEIERPRRGLPRTECAIERTLIHLGRSRVGLSARPADSWPMTGRTHATAWCTLYVASTLAGRDGRTGLTNSPLPSSFSRAGRLAVEAEATTRAGGRSSRRR